MPAAVDRRVVEQRILEEAARLPSVGAVSGWAALRLAGGNFFDGTVDGHVERPVDLVVPPPRALRRAGGIVVHHDRLPDEQVVIVQGIACTTPERALFDEIKWSSSWRAAVAPADMALSAGLVTFGRMRAHLTDRPAERGVARAARVLELADDRVLSPKETELRMIWVLDAGLPRPRCNWPVADATGRRIGRPDLLSEETGVVGEYDGAEHRGLHRQADDVAKEGDYRNAGLECFRVVGRDLANRRLVVRRMQDAVARAGASGIARTWLLRSDPGPL